MSKRGSEGGQNSSENIEARRVYREFYFNQDEETRKNLPPPEEDMDVTGMDGNWVFPVNEGGLNGVFDKAAEEEEEVSQRMYTEDEVEEVIRRVVMAMQMSENPDVLFQARCILIALGIGDPPKESELARLKGCSRQFVSKKVKRIQSLFNLTPSQYMRSNEACKAYSRAYWDTKKRRRKRRLDNPDEDGRIDG